MVNGQSNQVCVVSPTLLVVASHGESEKPSVFPLRLFTVVAVSCSVLHIHSPSPSLPLSWCHRFDALLTWPNRSPAIPAVLDPSPHALLILKFNLICVGQFAPFTTPGPRFPAPTPLPSLFSCSRPACSCPLPAVSPSVPDTCYPSGITEICCSGTGSPRGLHLCHA